MSQIEFERRFKLVVYIWKRVLRPHFVALRLLLTQYMNGASLSHNTLEIKFMQSCDISAKQNVKS